MSILVKKISKVYGDQRALDEVSFEVGKGEIVGFLGPNGAGKSTLMKILTTSLAPTSGTAQVNGFDVQREKRSVQRSIGYLPEHNPLYTEMYVKEYLHFNRRIYRSPKERVDRVIDQTGLRTEAHKRIGALSKGYRQRVGLAAALLHNPDVLVLDEPTTGLDPNQLGEIRFLIKEMGNEKTVFFSTHIMQEVEAICDRVIIVNKGRVVADRRLEALRKGQDQVIEVEFDYRVEDVLLRRIPHVKEVTNPYDLVYELSFNVKKDMRPTIFDFAHDNGLKTLKLNPKNKNLESLFRELTAEA